MGGVDGRGLGSDDRKGDGVSCGHITGDEKKMKKRTMRDRERGGGGALQRAVSRL